MGMMKNIYLDSLVNDCVESELSLMNTSCQLINDLEKDLTSYRNDFNKNFYNYKTNLDQMKKSLKKCLLNVHPYLEMKKERDALMAELNQIVPSFIEASKSYEDSKNEILKLEKNVSLRNETFNETLDQYVEQCNISKNEKAKYGVLHENILVRLNNLNQNIRSFEIKNKRCIKRTEPYFEKFAHFQQNMKARKERIESCQSKVDYCKLIYAQALNNLERISTTIHSNRCLPSDDEEPVDKSDSQQRPDDLVGNLKMQLKQASNEISNLKLTELDTDSANGSDEAGVD